MPHTVIREDFLGNRYTMPGQKDLAKDAAEAVAERYTSLGHHQTYTVHEYPDGGFKELCRVHGVIDL